MKFSKKAALAAVGLLLFGVLVGIGLNSALSRPAAVPAEGSIQLDKDALPYSASQSEASSDSTVQTSIAVPGYPDVDTDSAEKEIPITLVNPAENPCYFQFNVTLSETGESLYQSGWVEPGMAIYGIALDDALAPGDYTMLLAISTRSLADESMMSGANVEVGLHIR